MQNCKFRTTYKVLNLVPFVFCKKIVFLFDIIYAALYLILIGIINSELCGAGLQIPLSRITLFLQFVNIDHKPHSILLNSQVQKFLIGMIYC